MGWTPTRYHVAALQAALESARERQAQAGRCGRPPIVAGLRRLCRRPEAAIRASASPTSIRRCGRRRRRRWRRCSTAANAPSLSDYVRNMGWMHPIYGQLREALADHKYSDDHQRQLARAQPAAGARASGGQAALRAGQCGAAAALHVRGRQAGRLDGRRRRQAQISDADARRLHPLCRAQPLLVCAVRTSPASDVAPICGEVRPQISRRAMGYEVVSDWSPNPTVIDPKTIDWKARRRRQGRDHHPPEARARRISWAG